MFFAVFRGDITCFFEFFSNKVIFFHSPVDDFMGGLAGRGNTLDRFEL
jgi:hypothetical protein